MSLTTSLALKSFDPKVNFHHYISLAKKKLLDEKTRTHQKSFLYAFRALLCAKWIADKKSIPPVEFKLLVERYIDTESLKRHLSKLVLDKAMMAESDEHPLNDALWEYCNTVLSALSHTQVSSSGLKTKALYDEILLKIINFY